MKKVKFRRLVCLAFCILLLGSGPTLVGLSKVFANETPVKGSSLTSDNLGDGIETWIPTGSFETSSFTRVSNVLPESFPEQNKELNLLAVQNGHVSAQLAITSAADLQDVQVEVSDLQSNVGEDVIQQKHIGVYYPSFIPVSGSDNEVIADPLIEADRIDIPARDAQPVWFKFDIPKQTKPGKYNGQINIAAKDKEPVIYDFTIEVADVTLPNPDDFKFHLNLWMQPDAVAVAHDVEKWSDEHWSLMEKYIGDIASRGQKVINAVVADDPWQIRMPDGSYRAQTYTPYGSLVDWNYDGTSWSFDYEQFDKYVDVSLENGMGPYIHAFGMVMFGHDHLKYTDTRTGEVVDETVELGGPLWEEAWSAFLSDFEQHLRDKGWLDQTLLAFDERPLASMQVAFDLLEEVAPVFQDKLAVAANSNGLEPHSEEISFNYSDTGIASSELIEKRKAEGKITTFYTYYNPHHPNTNTGSPLVGSRSLPWISAQHNLDGYLRWTYNSWPMDVFNEPTYNYTQGDEYIVYPGEDGPLSSLRWEMFRNGVEDFELIEQLKEKAGSNNVALKKALEMVDADAPPSKEVYDNMLQAREMVIAELERFGDVAVSLDPDQTEVKAGDVLKVNAVLHNMEKDKLTDVAIDLNMPAGWEVKAIKPNKTSIINPDEKFQTTFEVTVPNSEQEGRIVQLEGEASFERKGEHAELPLNSVIEVLDPRIIPQSQMTATATSEEVGVDSAAHAIDGSSDTMWHTAWSGTDTLPQSITVDLGGTYALDEFSYLPRQSGPNGIITQYKLYTSTDGIDFKEVASGNWANDNTEKVIQIPEVEASHVKLEAIQGAGGYASAAEINVFQVVHLKTSISDMKILVERFEDEGEFQNDRAVRSLKTHLIALERYEKQEKAEKVIKHLKGFKLLLDQQLDKELISKKAYNALKTHADALVEKWG